MGGRQGVKIPLLILAWCGRRARGLARGRAGLSVLALTGVVSVALGAAAPDAQRAMPDPALEDPILPDQAGVERFALANGLGVVVVPTGQYARGERGGENGGGGGVGGRVQLWLVVQGGSMYEDDTQRGAAEVLRRVLMSGMQGLSGAQIRLAMGLDEDDDGADPSNGASMVSFDQALYTASVDLRGEHHANTGKGTGLDGGLGAVAALEPALGVFASLLDPGRWVVDEQRVDACVQALIDEVESHASPVLRARQRWLPELLSGTLLGSRLPIGDEASLRALTPESVMAFGRAHYGAGTALLLVVGDVDPGVVRAAVGPTLGALAPGTGPGAVVDGRLGVDVSGRSVLGTDPGYEGAQAALVWFEDRGDESVRPWSERAGAYRRSDLRALVVDRVAGEIVRHRLGRLSVAALGGDADLSVTQIDLWGQADLLQIGVGLGDRSGHSWEEAMGFLVRECDRLHASGAVDEELARARRSVLSRWHREARDWRTQGDGARAGMVHWLVTTGRPVLDMVRFDALATGLMSTVTDAQIDEAVRAMTDPRRAAAVGVERGPAGAARSPEQRQRVADRVAAALKTPLEPIGADWIQKLSGPLLDERPSKGEVVEITRHPPSGVLGATLGNGVRLWARATEGDEGRVFLTATVWGDGIASGAIGEAQLRAAMVAWSNPGTESRGSAAVAGFMKEHGIELDTRAEIGGAQLRISAPGAELGSALELLYVLLDEPMIEPGAYERWRQDPPRGPSETLDRALDMLYPGVRGAAAGDGEISLDDAQRVLTQLVRGGNIDIGIAGAISTDDAVTRAAELLGALVGRDGGRGGAREMGAGSGVGVDSGLGGRGVRTVTVRGDRAWERGVVRGYVGSSTDDLPTMRAAIVASMVLGDRLRALADERGLKGKVGANVVRSDAIPGRWTLLIRAYCDPSQDRAASEIIDDAISAIEQEGIGEPELELVQSRLEGSIGAYFGTGAYWSARMSTLGLNGRSLDELWTIRQGYASVTTRAASSAIGDVLVSREQFKIVVTGGEGKKREKNQEE